MAQAVREILSRPLPDYPVTFPISWGIPAPFPEVAGQVVNPSAEAMAWSIHCTALAAERRGAVLAAEDELWFPEAGSRVVYFLGFDNTYPFAVAGTALLMACGGRYALPAQFVTNEFYELDNDKLSTSRGHVVWGRDLVAEVPRDLVRFHLAVTSPEHQRTGFSHAALAQVTESRLVRPWNRVAAKVGEWVGGGPLPVSGRSHAAGRTIVERFAAAYELPEFSLNRAAGTLTEQLARLAQWDVTGSAAGDFCHEVDVLLRCAAPILVDLAAAALPDTAIPTGAGGPTETTPAPLPRLSTRVGAA
jgi:methionyl-tRNA synthetase